MSLRWENSVFKDVEWAYSGELVIGMIGRRENGTCWYSVRNSVNMGGIAKSYGEVRSLATGKRAVERAWSRWLAATGLQPIPTSDLYRHEKRGTTYTQLGRGALQASGPVYEGAILVAYVAQDDGRLWFRPAGEFDDGRFTKVE